jgi:hypothetical protein
MHTSSLPYQPVPRHQLVPTGVNTPPITCRIVSAHSGSYIGNLCHKRVPGLGPPFGEPMTGSLGREKKQSTTDQRERKVLCCNTCNTRCSSTFAHCPQLAQLPRRITAGLPGARCPTAAPILAALPYTEPCTIRTGCMAVQLPQAVRLTAG